MASENQKPAPTKAAPNAPKGTNGTKPAGGIPKPAPAKPTAAPPPPPPPFFRSMDWVTAGVTALLVFIGYFLTLSPDLTLEDSGELAVGSFYAGVPHPPGYPVWTLYSWLFTVLVPVSNIAYRVSLSSAFAGAVSCGLLALITSRGSSMILESIEEFKNIDRKLENALCMMAGWVAGMLLGFNGYMWSQAVIVEVYTFSALSLMGVLCCLLRWMYAPEQKRYLYWACFLFGICFTNHQTLIVAAMGIEIAILARDPKLGRDLLFFNSAVFVVGLMLKASGSLGPLASNQAMFNIFILIGLISMAACFVFAIKTQSLLTEWKTGTIMGLLWILGALFYLYMPLASMSNPPMNWGYARHVEGFFHALSRGQYEKANPTIVPERLITQLNMLKEGAMEEFTPVLLLVAIVPFLFFKRMKSRERAWLIGLASTYACLAFLLLILLNPSPDRQSRELTKVFFTASHIMIAACIGYGLVLLTAWLHFAYTQRRRFFVIGSAIATALSLYVTMVIHSGTDTPPPVHSGFGHAVIDLLFSMPVEPSGAPLDRFNAKYGFAWAVLLTLTVIVVRKKAPVWVLIGLFALFPVQSVLSHWAKNEQRGHLFGFWFGHDMFTPPFVGADGKFSYSRKERAEMVKKPGAELIYPEMTPNAVLFGGTDPGRFCPTYMIFAESFIPAEKRRDPEFDRRDVYIITQNALADATYLMYIRAHYNRSTQPDEPFFQKLFARLPVLSSLASPFDTLFLKIGANIEKRRRDEGVYPPKEIHTPSLEDSQRSFEEYVTDAQKRLKLNQLKPGEDVRVVDNKIQVSGQVAVMAINGLLTKVIFDKNPDHEFFVEESFPLDWMFPYLTPFGIIMKINRQPLPELTEDIVRRDHEFWSKYTERSVGNWITYDTTVSNICSFAERTYLRHNLEGFKGDPKFMRDDDAQKAFSKLRSAIAGMYSFRINESGQRGNEAAARGNEAAKSSRELAANLTLSPAQRLAEQQRLLPEQQQSVLEQQRWAAVQQRMIKEAEFAFKQAFAFCPYSPEAVFRYINLLSSLGRIDDALMVAKTFKKLDPNNAASDDLISRLSSYRAASQVPQPQNQLTQAEAQFRANPANGQLGLGLFSAYLQAGNTNQAYATMDALLSHSNTPPDVIIAAAQALNQVGQPGRAQIAAARAIPLYDRLLTNAQVDHNTLVSAAQAYSMVGNLAKMEQSMTRLVALNPNNPEGWYDLAAIQTLLNKSNDALKSLTRALTTSDLRLAQMTNQPNLRQNVPTDPRFANIRALPEFQGLLHPIKPPPAATNAPKP